MDTSPYWKKIWYTLTGRSKLTTEDDIRNIFKIVKQDICVGISKFKEYSEETFEEWKKVSNRSSGNVPLEQFIKKMSEVLNLEAIATWKILCNFLMFEYYGSVIDIERTADVEIYNASLFEQVWLFYSSERMYLIKSWKHIMENCLHEKHKFNDLYMDFISSFKFHNFRNCLFKQFECLIYEITMDNSSHCLDFRDWVNRNIQEQFEILNCIILSGQYLPLSLAEFRELFSIFKKHNFTLDPIYYRILEAVNPEDLRRIRRLEVISLVTGLNPCWENMKMWRPHIEEIEEMLMTVEYEGDLCILLLTWTTLQMTLPQKVAAERFNSYYHKFTRVALKENVFLLMYQIVSDPVFQNSSIFYIIQKTFYNILDYVCDKFDEEGSILQHQGVIQLSVELIKNAELADKFFHDGGENAGVIYKVLYEMFPCTFEGYSEIVLQLLKHNSLISEVVATLSNFQYYTEEYTERCNDSVVCLMGHYCPYNCVKIRAHSEAFIFTKYGRTFVRYESNYSYFALTEEKADVQIMKKLGQPGNNLRDIELGYEILGILVIHSYYSDSEQVKSLLDTVGNVLINVSKKPDMNYRLMKTCLNIYVTLMEGYSEQILDMLIVYNFLPYITKNPNDLKNYFDKNFLNRNIILLSIGDQLVCGEFDILLSYIKLIKATPMTNQNVLRVQIPGLVFLFLHFFPMHLDITYNEIHKKHELTLLCLEYLLEILNTPYDDSKEYDKVIYDFCYGIVVNYEPSANVFIRIFRSSNLYLHTRMMKESNWNDGLTFTIINCVKTCINILIRIFILHNKNEKSLLGTYFFSKFLDNNMKPSSLKVLIGYLNHAFDPALPRLVCQLLKKIAANSTIPILALLEMDHYQIQSAFLEKLRDPLEEDSVKIAILELITLSIEKQDGLTVAFFDLRQYSFKKGDVHVGDSITSFMEEYLNNIKKSPTYLNSPIQAAVLDLFHTLWMYRKDILVEHLIKGEYFWETLADPLFRELKLPDRTYSQIFNIITFELFKSKGENHKINAILDKLFNKEGDFTKIWCDHVIASLIESNIEMSGQSLLRSWKNLIMSVVLTYPQCLEELALQRLLTETCLNGLIQHFSQPDDIRILTSWAELYLFLIKRWTNTYKDHRETFTTLTRVFKYLGEYYNHVSNNFKEIIISIAIQTIEDLREFVSVNHLLVERYLNSIGIIYEREYMKIFSENVQPIDEISYNEWLLLVIFGNKLISMDFVQTHPTWFCLTQFGQKILSSVGLFTSNPVFFKIAKVAVQCLINYARTSMYTEFLSVDFEAFFDSTRPPKRYIYTDILTFKNAVPWYFEEWWSTYTGIMHLLTILLEKIHTYRLNIFFSFISIHHDIIRNILKLPRVTAEKTALKLTSVCLHFCYKLMPWRQEWKVNHAHIYFSVIATIYETINAVTCIFLRPKILTFFTMDKDGKLSLLENIPLEHLVNIMNELMRIIALSSMCLLRAGQSLLALLIPPIKTSCISDIDIDFDFHIPQVYEDEPQRITYGTALCLLHFLCKTVTYIHTQKVTPQKQSKPQAEGKSTIKSSLAFVCPDFAGGYTISERYSSLSSEISGLSAPWLTKLNLTNVILALEAFGSVIASQTYIYFNIRSMRHDLRQHFKRELCSELMYFYEFIRKRFVDTNQYRIIENMVYRKYITWQLPYATNINTSDEEGSFVKKNATDTSSSDDEDFEFSFNKDKSIEKINHDDNDADDDPSVFFSRHDFHEIDISVSDGAGDARTGKSTTISRISEKSICGKRVLNEHVVKTPLDEVLLKYPKAPEIKESDYLLCLTHWFIFFCDLSH